MLRCMQQPAQSQPSPTSQSFAGLLATLASPAREEAEPAPEWSGGDLGEDVVTLSYERALHAHARYRPVDSSHWPITQPRQTGVGETEEAPALPPALIDEGLNEQATEAPQGVNDRDLRTVSVTIRLNKGECARLHQRAAEAGVTVSAYLRSCTFEAEALRAQVKEALAELRSAGAQGTEGTREQGTKGLRQRGNRGVRLARVLAHMGNLWIGLSSDKSS